MTPVSRDRGLKPLKSKSSAYRIADKLTFDSKSTATANPIGKPLAIDPATLQASFNAVNNTSLANELAEIVSSAGFVETFARARINGKMYTTAKFDLENNGKMRRSILGFEKDFGEVVAIIAFREMVYFAINMFNVLPSESSVISLPHGGQFVKSRKIIVRKALDLKCFQAILVESENMSIVARLPNYMETDHESL